MEIPVQLASLEAKFAPRQGLLEGGETFGWVDHWWHVSGSSFTRRRYRLTGPAAGPVRSPRSAE
jgi:hypothetical protein